MNSFFSFTLVKKYSRFVPYLLILGVLWSSWYLPSMAWIFAVAAILFVLSASMGSIFEKYKGSEDQRGNMMRDISMMILTLGLVLLFGGLAGNFAGNQARVRFGPQVGIFCALAVGFAIGYLVKKVMGRMFGGEK